MQNCIIYLDNILKKNVYKNNEYVVYTQVYWRGKESILVAYFYTLDTYIIYLYNLILLSERFSSV